MKLTRLTLLAAATGLLVSCFGKEEEPAAAPAKPAQAHNPRPDRPPPPPQPQDGSMIVRPGGTQLTVPEISEIKEIPELGSVSDADKKDALSAAETEIIRRKKDVGDGDDAVSKALRNISEEDLDRAFTELKKAADKYPDAGE